MGTRFDSLGNLRGRRLVLSVLGKRHWFIFRIDVLSPFIYKKDSGEPTSTC